MKAEQPLTIRLNDELSDTAISIDTVSSVKISESKISGNSIEQTIAQPGIYIIEAKTNKGRSVLKIISK